MHTDTAAIRPNCKHKCRIAVESTPVKSCGVDKVMHWLEREDTVGEQLIGYGICVVAGIYFLAGLLRFIF